MATITIDPVDGTGYVDAAQHAGPVTITGTTDAAAVTLTLYQGSDATGTPVYAQSVAAQGGSYSATIKAKVIGFIPDGNYFVTATTPDGATAGESVTVDTMAPNFTGITASSNTSGPLMAGQSATITVEADGPLAFNGTPTLKLSNGATATLDPQLTASAEGQGKAVFDYTASPGDSTTDLQVANLDTSNGNLTDRAGNPLAGGVSGDTGLAVDAPKPAPTITLDPVAGDDRINAGESTQNIIFSGTTTGVAEGTHVTITVRSLDDPSLTPLQNSTATVGGDGSFSTLLPGGAIQSYGLPDGSYAVTADVTDPSNGPAPEADRTVSLDTQAPVLSAGNVSHDGGQPLVAGNTVHFFVNSSEAVVLSGTPMLTLSDGANAVYDAGLSDPSKLAFDYTVQAGDQSSDLKADGSSLAGGIVSDAAGNVAAQGVSFDTGLVVNGSDTGPGTGPGTGPSPSPTPTIALAPVSGDNVLNQNDLKSAIVVGGTATEAEGQTVTVGVHDAKGALLYAAQTDVTNGAFSVTIDPALAAQIPSGTYGVTADVANAYGVPAPQSSETVTVDAVAPTLTGAGAVPSTAGTLQAGDAVLFTVSSDEAVTVTGSPVLHLDDGGTAAYAPNYSGPNALRFVYSVQPGDMTSDLTATGLDLAGGAITDGAGNAAVGTVSIDSGIAVGAGGTTGTNPTGGGEPSGGTPTTGGTTGTTPTSGGEPTGGTPTTGGDMTGTPSTGGTPTTTGTPTTGSTDTGSTAPASSTDPDLVVGVTGQPYTSIRTNRGADGAVTGQSFYDDAGNLVYGTTIRDLGNGFTSVTTSGGSYFDDQNISAFTDRFQDGQLIAETARYKDGTHTVAAEADGQTLRSVQNDEFVTSKPDGGFYANTNYVYTPGSGHDTIDHFRLTGPGHDTLTLPGQAANLASIIRHAEVTSSGVELHFNPHDSLSIGFNPAVFAGLDADQLKAKAIALVSKDLSFG